ncbi:hypothetical protein [uncultured Gemella sp.]|uniref:hypothetical protein n=1 Tax=uncultured Gemella sp. TaxID=254352 RepID=UPI0028D2B4FC|nr:hypothetical protein [uncultured Gemella sp.]
MAKPNWNKTLSEVLKHPTIEVLLTSKNTGKEYTADIVRQLPVVSTGVMDEVEGGFKYSIVDTKNNLEYTIKAPQKLDVKFGTILVFRNVRGGATSTGSGWYSAESVEVAQRNE